MVVTWLFPSLEEPPDANNMTTNSRRKFLQSTATTGIAAATLAAFPAVPVAGLALIFGIDRFMSEARSLTNLIGNGVATVVVARWEGALDVTRMHRVLNGEVVAEVQSPPKVEPAAVA